MRREGYISKILKWRRYIDWKNGNGRWKSGGLKCNLRIRRKIWGKSLYMVEKG